MKIFTSCPHINMDEARQTALIGDFGNRSHDGRYFIIEEKCQDCMMGSIVEMAEEAPLKVEYIPGVKP